MTTRKPPIEIEIDSDSIAHMNYGDIPIHSEESEIAHRDLDDPSRVEARKGHLDGIQQNLDLNIMSMKSIKKLKPSTTTLGMLFRMERAKRGWTHDEVVKQLLDKTGNVLDRRNVGRIEQGKPVVPNRSWMEWLIDLYGMDRKSIYEIYHQIKDQVIEMAAIERKALSKTKTVQQTTSVDINDILSDKNTVPAPQDRMADVTDLIGTPACGCIGSVVDIKKLMENAGTPDSGMTPQEERAAYVTPIGYHMDRLYLCSQPVSPVSQDKVVDKVIIRDYIDTPGVTGCQNAESLGVQNTQSISLLAINKTQLSELLISAIKKLPDDVLCDMAKNIGIPVILDSVFRVFRLELYAYCPLCRDEVDSSSMKFTEFEPPRIIVTCKKCNVPVMMPFNALIKTKAEK
jgi:hypothetical protein